MGKMKELFMQVREQEMTIEDCKHLDDEYHYEKYIQEKYKSPKHACFMKDSEDQLVMIQGNTFQELEEIAHKHKLQGEFQIMSPKKHLF